MGELWVCEDCYVWHHYGDEREYDVVPWSEWLDDPDFATISEGSRCELTKELEYVNDDCAEYSCECNTREFSSQRCGGCGTYLAGTRHLMTWGAN